VSYTPIPPNLVEYKVVYHYRYRLVFTPWCIGVFVFTEYPYDDSPDPSVLHFSYIEFIEPWFPKTFHILLAVNNVDPNAYHSSVRCSGWNARFNISSFYVFDPRQEENNRRRKWSGNVERYRIIVLYTTELEQIINNLGVFRIYVYFLLFITTIVYRLINTSTTFSVRCLINFCCGCFRPQYPHTRLSNHSHSISSTACRLYRLCTNPVFFMLSSFR
jgi:hypothetical protein